MARPRFDLPTPDLETEEWWEACKDGRFLLRRCNACAEVHFYPRPFCPSCWSEDVEWIEASGRATLYTYSVVRRNDLPPWGDRVPYVPAIVDLEEGPRAMTDIVGCDPDGLDIGMSLEVVFEDRGEDGAKDGDETLVVPCFTPA